jgi:hypothetical protein
MTTEIEKTTSFKFLPMSLPITMRRLRLVTANVPSSPPPPPSPYQHRGHPTTQHRDMNTRKHGRNVGTFGAPYLSFFILFY